MKKQSLLLITGGLLALASCNSENTGNAEAAQAKIDSMVNARVEQIRTELAAQNDSIINVMAMERADSIMAAMSGKKVVKKKAAEPAPKPKVYEDAAMTNVEGKKPANPKDARFGGEADKNTAEKEARFNEDAAQKLKEESAKKKADRFK